MPDFFMTTNRLGFRTWQHQDLPLAIALWGDHRVTCQFYADSPLSAEKVKAKMDLEIQRLETQGYQYWPMFQLEDGQFVGVCGLRPYDLKRGICETGFHLIPNHWRKGYAVEAACAVFDRAFDHHGVSALLAGHSPANPASKRTLTKLGFRFTHNEYYEPMKADHPTYLLEPEDWHRARQSPALSDLFNPAGPLKNQNAPTPEEQAG